MPRVLIPSDNRDYVVNWAEGYAAAGYEVVTGLHNFEMRQCAFDLIHYLWPEELCDWKLPTRSELDRIRDRVEWWQRRCTTILTVNNLYPHRYERHPMAKELYEIFYDKCTLITHFSEASMRLVKEEFPAARHDRHILTTPFNYDSLLAEQPRRGSCRSELGFLDDDFVVLSFGALRSWDEVRLLRRAIDRAKIPHKRLLMAGRYLEPGPRFRKAIRKLRWVLWLKQHKACMVTSYIPSEDLYKYLDSSDVVVVPRLSDLSSGLPGLAMTFGRVVIAPRHGAFPDYLAGTENILYDSGDAKSLAEALEKAAAMDRKKVGQRSREVVDAWNWDQIVATCLAAVANLPVRSEPRTSAAR